MVPAKECALPAEPYKELDRHPDVMASALAGASCLRRCACLGVVALVVLLLVARDAAPPSLRSSSRNFDEASFHSECLHPMGGGLVLSGGGFKPLNDSVLSKECALELHEYFNQEEGQYWVDVARVAEAAREHFDDLASSEPPSSRKMIVFDIDETTLSNAVEFQQRLQQHLQQHLQQQQQQQHQGCRKSLMREAAPTATAADAMAAQGAAQAAPAPRVLQRLGKAPLGASNRPPLAAMLALYQYLYSSGYSVAFITGRKESERNSTALNLKNAGYGTLCKKHDAVDEGEADLASGVASSACYTALHLRDEDDNRFASVYKPERRAALERAGYDIYGNFGDQFSDLDGTTGAPHSFKLPNPGYLIL